MSSFHGLEMAKQALFAQQSALYTTGHNIANANTEGYSRQRVNFQTTPAYPTPGRNRPDLPGQMGTGVEVGSVQRIRDSFLDKQYRAENSRSGYWDTVGSALSRMEELLNEPSDSGLSKTMDQFWESLQDLAGEPGSSGARSVVTERGLAVAGTFNYLSGTLDSIRTDLAEHINVTEENVNSLLNQINNINDQIKQIEPHGHLSNDLYDERDRLIDELSNIVNINVEYTGSGGDALEIAPGIATIELVTQGESPINLIDGVAGEYNELSVKTGEVTTDSGTHTVVTGVEVNGQDVDILKSDGSLKGLVEAYGYEDEAGYKGEYPEIMDQLDEIAKSFAIAFNDAHKEGFDINGDEGQNFFEISDENGAAASITVHQDILDEGGLIAASTEDSNDGSSGTVGNGQNAFNLADALDNPAVRKSFESLIGTLGVNAQEANRMSTNTQVLRSQVEERRLSISAVSIDEEMTNMIKFQHAYNAAARSMTTVDEMLDRIINGMGLVGR